MFTHVSPYIFSILFPALFLGCPNSSFRGQAAGAQNDMGPTAALSVSQQKRESRVLPSVPSKVPRCSMGWEYVPIPSHFPPCSMWPILVTSRYLGVGFGRFEQTKNMLARLRHSCQGRQLTNQRSRLISCLVLLHKLKLRLFSRELMRLRIVI